MNPQRFFVTRAWQLYGLIGILIIFSGLVLIYDFTVPFFEKPDELKHFAVIQFIHNRQTLPVVEAGVYKPWDQEGTQPPFYYILAALATAWLDLSDFEEPPRNPHYVDERSFIWFERGNNNLYLHRPGESWRWESIVVAAHLSRWVSLLAGLCTITLTYWLAKIIFDDSPAQPSIGESGNQRFTIWPWLPLFSAALVAFIPQFIHVSSAITNDSLTVTLAAAALVLMALMIKDGAAWQYVIYLGIILGLGAITKLSLLYLGLLVGLVMLFDLTRHRSWRRFMGQSAIIGGLTLLLAGWWYGRNWQLYGDVTALSAHLLYRGGALDPPPSLAQIRQTELTGLELSFWAAFGAGQILLEPWIYELLRWVKFLAFGGIGLGFWLGIRDQVPAGVRCRESGAGCQVSAAKVCSTQLIILALLLLWCLIIFIALLRWMQITPASWGRLLYPALPALGVLSAWGLAQYGQLVARRPSRSVLRFGNFLSILLPSLLVLGLLALSAVAPFRYIRAAYAKTPLLAQVNLPPALRPVDLVYDETLRLLGYTVGKPALRPGEWLPVTLYWQALNPIDKNYSAFVHLLTAEGKVGQSNTYPDRGNWPTSYLEPGDILKDTHYLRVSPQTEVPAVARLALGIFEFDDPQRTAKTAVNPAGEGVEPIVGALPLIPHQWPTLNPTHLRPATFAGQIKLVGYDWPGPLLEAGETVPLTLYWETVAPPDQNLNLFIHLIDSTGQQIAGFDAPPEFPTRFWQPGYTLIDERQLALPSDLLPGDYQLVIGWYNLDDFSRLPLAEGGDALTLFNFSIAP